MPLTLPISPAVEVPTYQANAVGIEAIDRVVRLHYPSLISSVHASLAVFGAMALKNRTRSLTA